MKDIENTKKESPVKEAPFLGLTGMGGGVNSLMWAGAAGNPGLLYMWGEGTRGQLDNNDSELGAHNADRSSPTQVGTENTWAYVSLTNAASAAIKTDGTLWTWGDGNGRGQLGTDSIAQRSSPCQVGTDTTWSYIEGGGEAPRFFALKTNGTLWGWGRNDGAGGLGLNDSTNRSSPTQVGSGTNWTRPRTGGDSTGFSGALQTDGKLFTWGSNNQGRLGHNNTTSYSSPKQLPGTWASFEVCGSNYINAAMGVKTDGTLWTWGWSEEGALGLNEGGSTNYSSPKQVGSDNTWDTGDYKIAMGNAITFGIKTNGTLWAWGLKSYGALGTDDNTNYSSPVQVGSNTNWDKVRVTKASVAGLKTDGTLWMWGRGDNGQIGTGTNTSNYESPRQVQGSWSFATTSGVTVAAITK